MADSNCLFDVSLQFITDTEAVSEKSKKMRYISS